jgi:hypothetical protein
VLRRREGTCCSSPSDDEVGGTQSAIRAERAPASGAIKDVSGRFRRLWVGERMIITNRDADHAEVLIMAHFVPTRPAMRDDPSVVALVTRATKGDQRAWDELVERYASLVYAICTRYRLSRDDIEDVGQTVWLLLVEHLGRLREPAALPGWLATTTAHECLRVVRRGTSWISAELGTTIRCYSWMTARSTRRSWWLSGTRPCVRPSPNSGTLPRAAVHVDQRSPLFIRHDPSDTGNSGGEHRPAACRCLDACAVERTPRARGGRYRGQRPGR